MVPMHPNHAAQEIEAIIHNIEMATREALGDMSAAEAKILPQKFGMATV